VWIFAGAYLLVWTGFSVAATLLQALLEQASLLTPAMTSASTALSAVALVVAGAYQLTPLKQTCLSKCRNPLEFFVTRWRAGRAGAFRMGLEHGAYCVGCCWALMLLLFVAGVMNLLWVALIAVFVLVEKLFPAALVVSRATGAMLILTGLYLLTQG
jgi:predicted metal-binding membrane protein